MHGNKKCTLISVEHLRPEPLALSKAGKFRSIEKEVRTPEHTTGPNLSHPVRKSAFTRPFDTCIPFATLSWSFPTSLALKLMSMPSLSFSSLTSSGQST